MVLWYEKKSANILGVVTDVADVQECQTGQEKIHGWSQLQHPSNCDNDKDVAWQNDHIEEQEEEEENHLDFMVLGQSQQNKLCNHCIVLMLHFRSAEPWKTDSNHGKNQTPVQIYRNVWTTWGIFRLPKMHALFPFPSFRELLMMKYLKASNLDSH